MRPRHRIIVRHTLPLDCVSGSRCDMTSPHTLLAHMQHPSYIHAISERRTMPSRIISKKIKRATPIHPSVRHMCVLFVCAAAIRTAQTRPTTLLPYSDRHPYHSFLHGRHERDKNRKLSECGSVKLWGTNCINSSNRPKPMSEQQQIKSPFGFVRGIIRLCQCSSATHTRRILSTLSYMPHMLAYASHTHKHRTTLLFTVHCSRCATATGRLVVSANAFETHTHATAGRVASVFIIIEHTNSKRRREKKKIFVRFSREIHVFFLLSLLGVVVVANDFFWWFRCFIYHHIRFIWIFEQIQRIISSISSSVTESGHFFFLSFILFCVSFCSLFCVFCDCRRRHHRRWTKLKEEKKSASALCIIFGCLFMCFVVEKCEWTNSIYFVGLLGAEAAAAEKISTNQTNQWATESVDLYTRLCVPLPLLQCVCVFCVCKLWLPCRGRG